MKKSRRQRNKAKNKPQSVVLDPKMESIYRQQVQQHLNKNQFAMAVDKIDAIKKCNPDADISTERTQLLKQRGTWRLNNHDYTNALNDFQELHNKFQETEICFYGIAKSYVCLDKPDAAEAFLQKAITEKTLLAKDHVLFLKTLILQEKWTDAQTLIDDHPTWFAKNELEWAKGVLALHNKKNHEALRHFNKSLAAQSIATTADHAWKAYSLILEKKFQEARSLIKQIQQGALKGWLFMHDYEYSQDPASLNLANRFLPRSEKKNENDVWFIEELESTLQHESPLEVADLIDENPDEFSRLPNKAKLEKLIYRWGASTAYLQGFMDEAEKYWNRSLLLNSNDWVHYQNVILKSWGCEFKNFPDWVKKSEKLLDSLAQTEPNVWTPEQVQFTKGELAGYLALHYAIVGKKLREKTDRKKANDFAPQGFSCLLLKAFDHYQAKNWQEAANLYQQFESEGGAINRLVYEHLKDIYQNLQQLEAFDQLRQKYGPGFGDAPASAQGIQDGLYFSLNKADFYFLEHCLAGLQHEPHILKDVATMVLQAAPKNQWDSRKKIECQTPLIEFQNFIEGTTNITLKIERIKFLMVGLDIFKKSYAHKKTLNYLKTTLIALSEDHYEALVALVQALGGVKKPTKEFRNYFDLLMKQTDNSSATLITLQRFWVVLENNSNCTQELTKALEKDPENPCLLWAYSTSTPYLRHRPQLEKSRDIARRLQHKEAFELLKFDDLFNELKDIYRSFNGERLFGGPFGSFDGFADEDEDDFIDDLFDKEFSGGGFRKPKGNGTPQPPPDIDPMAMLNMLGMATSDMSVEDILAEMEDSPDGYEDEQLNLQLLFTILAAPDESLKILEKSNFPKDLLASVRRVVRDAKRTFGF